MSFPKWIYLMLFLVSFSFIWALLDMSIFKLNNFSPKFFHDHRWTTAGQEWVLLDRHGHRWVPWNCQDHRWAALSLSTRDTTLKSNLKMHLKRYFFPNEDPYWEGNTSSSQFSSWKKFCSKSIVNQLGFVRMILYILYNILKRAMILDKQSKCSTFSHFEVDLKWENFEYLDCLSRIIALAVSFRML